MSRFFRGRKSESTSAPLDRIYDPFADIRERLKGFLTTGPYAIGATGPRYTGEQVAEPSEFEEKALGDLRRYQAGPDTTDTFKLARDEIRRTLAAGADPTSDPTYQAAKATAERESQLGEEQLGRTFATMPGRFFGGARMKASRDLQKDLGLGIQRTLADVIERQAGRRERFAGLAPEIERFETEAPARKAELGLKLGELPRNLLQLAMDKAKEDFLREQYDFPLSIAQLSSGLASQQPIWAQRMFTQGQPSIFQSLLSGLFK